MASPSFRAVDRGRRARPSPADRAEPAGERSTCAPEKITQMGDWVQDVASLGCNAGHRAPVVAITPPVDTTGTRERRPVAFYS